MIRIRLDGEQITGGSGGMIPSVRVLPFSSMVVEQVNQVFTVGALAYVLVFDVFTPGLPTPGYKGTFRNESTGGQIIGLNAVMAAPGNPPNFANMGIILYPGESLELDNIFTDIYAGADAAGGLLRVQQLSNRGV